jgi:hypothetical protein
MTENNHPNRCGGEAGSENGGTPADGHGPSHRQLMQHDAMFGYRFLPGLKLRVEHEGGGYLIKTNLEGFRSNSEVTPEKSKGMRILLFGDSYTAGDGVSNGKRYSEVLEKNLDDTEVLNFGLSGSGTDQQYLIYQQYAEKVEHDMVVIGVLVENIQRIVLESREWSDRDGQPLIVPKPWYELSAANELVLRGVPVQAPYSLAAEQTVAKSDAVGRFGALRKLVNMFGPEFKDSIQKLTRYQPLPEYKTADSQGWRLMRAILGQWIANSKVPVKIIVLPVYQYVEKTASYADIRKRFDEFAEASNVTVHHAVDDLWAYPASVRRTFRFRTDCHLTPLAHEVIGKSLAKILAREQGNNK